MREFDVIAVLEGRHPSPPMPDLQMIVQGDLTAVLSAAPHPASRLPKSLSRHLQDAALHLARQTACMWLAPLLPVRLDTPLTRKGAASFLTANHPFLTQLLARYAGMAQVQVTVCRPDAAQSALDGPTQAAALALSLRIGAELASISTEIASLPLAPGLVWSGVILLPLTHLSDLNRILEKVQSSAPDGVQVRQIGPDPVTSFATLDISPVTLRQLDQALAAFGMTSVADLVRLPAARRRRLTATWRNDDRAQREELGEQAEILSAAARLHAPREGFALLSDLDRWPRQFGHAQPRGGLMSAIGHRPSHSDQNRPCGAAIEPSPSHDHSPRVSP